MRERVTVLLDTNMEVLSEQDVRYAFKRKKNASIYVMNAFV